MTVWRWTFWALLVALASAAVIWLASSADAAPSPDAPPERRPLVSIADLTCERSETLPIRVGPEGLEVAIRDGNGCVVAWVSWAPMVRAR